MTRHQLKEQDEITTSLQTFSELLVARKKEAITGVSVIAALVIIYFGWSYYSSSRNARAQTELSQAINTYGDTTIKSDKERYQRTMDQAQKVADNYGSLNAGKIALYYVALSQEGLGDTPKAVQNLQDVAQRGDASIKGVAQFALGEVYKKHGDTQKAIDTDKALFDSGGYSRSAVAYELAMLYEANNQADQAKQFYQKVVTDFPDSPFRQNADDALKRLGVVTPPPKPS
jgi:predicted negative regulator of RcsB-dependent stress response